MEGAGAGPGRGGAAARGDPFILLSRLWARGPHWRRARGPAGPGWEGQAPGGHLTLSLFTPVERKRETSPLRLPPKSSSSAVPEDCKMFACAKLACTPALVRSPGRPVGGVVGQTSWPGTSTLLRWGNLRAGRGRLAPLALHPFVSHVLRCLAPNSGRRGLAAGLARCRSNPPWPPPSRPQGPLPHRRVRAVGLRASGGVGGGGALSAARGL